MVEAGAAPKAMRTTAAWQQYAGAHQLRLILAFHLRCCHCVHKTAWLLSLLHAPLPEQWISEEHMLMIFL
jgi:hypothetical protein